MASLKVTFDRATSQFTGLTDAVLAELAQAYPSVDISAELAKMRLWLLSPKGSGRRGNLVFIKAWLSRAPTKVQDREQLVTQDLQPVLDHYLGDLWKHKAHLLALNSMTALKTLSR